ncbi:FbpB family small basic protein [Virgibacillus oceani]|uniref:FbpB family small basic protein n=1 Tax=Virgibacillus oceani TaxID=1479511 RepID=A0A917M270_9BACI|nr:FbpB family small basic protein [Virgibacillus oceani]GGG70382.1 hypothetical protein GCM10011398_13090 [Virgibacillus oceani]
MRPKTQRFEQLVNQNRQELMQDEKRLMQIENRLEKKQTKLVAEKQNRYSLYDNIG